LRRYLQTPKATDQLKRDEATFYRQVWPILEQLRKKERNIQTYDRMQFGKEVPIWQLK